MSKTETLPADDALFAACKKIEHLEAVVAKVRRKCCDVIKGDQYSLFQKHFAESILTEIDQ